MYTKESLELLRQRIDLADVLSSHLHMQKAGAAFKALCPFHEEKTPSFMVQRGDTHYHCYGCGAHGDAIAFLMSHVKMTFVEAIEHLADRFQVTLEVAQGAEQKSGPAKSELKHALQLASAFYHYLLLYSEEGRIPLKYLYERGLDLSFLERFEIGYAPSQPDLLYRYLRGQGIYDEIIEAAGLMRINSYGKAKDFFSDRITFPIRDVLGSTIGFSARKFKEETFGGKYINTPETPLFKKSRVLFGLSDSRARIAKESQAIVVEGQIDCLRLIDSGFNYTVAGQGTAFGEEHVKELIQLGVKKVYLSLDGDQAGKEATVKIGHLFQKKGVGVFVVRLPDGADPDSLLRQSGPEAFEKLLLKSEQYVPFVYSHLSQGIQPLSPAKKNEIVNAVVAKVKEWEMPVMVHESLRQLAEISQVPEAAIGVGQISLPDLFIKKSGSVTFQQIDPNRIIEADFMRWLIFAPSAEMTKIAKSNIAEEHFVVPGAYRLYQEFLQSEEQKRPCDLLAMGACLATEEEQKLLTEIMQRKINLAKAPDGFVETVRKMLMRKWMQERESIRIQLQGGEMSEDEALVLAKRFDAIKNKAPEVIMS